MPAVLAAAEMLSHAEVEAICWNGTKGAIDGFQVDRDPCAAASERFGIPVTSVSPDAGDPEGRLDARRIALIPGAGRALPFIGERFATQFYHGRARWAQRLPNWEAAEALPLRRKRRCAAAGDEVRCATWVTMPACWWSRRLRRSSASR